MYVSTSLSDHCPPPSPRSSPSLLTEGDSTGSAVCICLYLLFPVRARSLILCQPPSVSTSLFSLPQGGLEPCNHLLARNSSTGKFCCPWWHVTCVMGIPRWSKVTVSSLLSIPRKTLCLHMTQRQGCDLQRQSQREALVWNKKVVLTWACSSNWCLFKIFKPSMLT